MRPLKESAVGRFGILQLAGALVLALACVPAVALAEENAGSEAPAAPDPVALTQDASEPDAKMPAADGGTDSSAAAMPSSNDADVPDVVADGADVGAYSEPSEGDGGDSADEPADPDSVQPAEPIVPGLKAVGDRFQYVNDDGSLVKSDWKTVDGKRYYFGSDGNSARWSWKIDGSWYYFNGACVMQTGWVTWRADGLKSYFDANGKALTGWQTIGNKRYYFDPSTGKSVRWEQRIGGANYYFNSASQMHTGLLTWRADGLKSYYGSDGKQLTGWRTVGGKTYYFSPSTGKSVRWEQRIGGANYYFNSASQMHTGLLTWRADGLKSYYGSDGKQLTGWQKVGGKWYYFKPSDGRSVRWEQKIANRWYYFNGASQMHIGWLKWNGKQQWSYYDGDGVRLGGTQTIGGYKYTFDKNGRTTTAPITRPYDEYVMEKKAQNYSSSTNYLIMVNRSTHKVGVFYKRSGRWEMTAYWDCVTGAPSTPTITGSFKTTGGKRSSLSTDSRAKYCTQITGGYFFHTILASNNELGKSLSHGCIRMSYSSAKWIYQHISAGTRVVIY